MISYGFICFHVISCPALLCMPRPALPCPALRCPALPARPCLTCLAFHALPCLPACCLPLDLCLPALPCSPLQCSVPALPCSACPALPHLAVLLRLPVAGLLGGGLGRSSRVFQQQQQQPLHTWVTPLPPARRHTSDT